jgi:chromosome partitioning protein
MPIIVFASPKGGVGKSTSALLLATELALNNATVTVIDADQNKPLSQWAAMEGCPANLTVLADVSESTIIDEIEAAAAKTSFVIVDLEGTANMIVAYAISRADLVVIPTQGSTLDGREAAKTQKLIRQQEKAFGITIPFAVLFTRTSTALKPRILRSIQNQFIQRGVRAFETQIHERDAYKALFSFGGTLSSLDRTAVRNVDEAVINASAFVGELVSMLREITQTQTAQVA